MLKPLRRYQQEALDLVAQRSMIVVLPTGSGKTLIAAKATQLSCTTTRKPTLLLVPTTSLVDQQQRAFACDTGLRVERFRGGLAVPCLGSFHALVATPDAVLQQQERFALQKFGLVVFDEVHHVVKSHPYRKIAQRLQSLTAEHRPKILGLSASLTYSVSEDDIEEDVVALCRELCLTGRCIYSASNEQLLKDGYRANHAVAQLCTPHTLFTHDFEMNLRSDKLLDDFLLHIKHRKVPPLHPLSLQLFDTIEQFESTASSTRVEFKSPIKEGKPAREWGTEVVKHQTASERGKVNACGPCVHIGDRGGPLAPGAHMTDLQVLEHLYEAAALIVNSKQSNLELAMMYLRMMGVLEEGRRCGGLLGILAEMWESVRDAMKRADHLKEVLQQASADHGGSLRCMVFVQQRLTTHILEHFLRTNDDPTIRQLRTACIYATNSPATPRFRVTRSQAASRIQDFATGAVTVLLSTSYAEEGLDVQAANCVVRFDEVQTPVSLVQSRGRARKADSSFKVMKEMPRKPVAKMQEAEEAQRRVIERIARCGLPKRKKAPVHILPATLESSLHLRSPRQTAGPNKSAGEALLRRFRADSEACRDKARGMLNQYAQVSSLIVTESGFQQRQDLMWEACLQLSSREGALLQASGTAPGKKAAVHAAAFNVLNQLSSNT